MKIAFVHNNKAFLPEIEAYRLFFERYGIQSIVIEPAAVEKIKPDVECRFMGTHFPGSRHSPVLIHEYASTSAPPYNDIKDVFKRAFTRKPDFRLFLNEYVKEKLAFTDAIPFGIRDMGISLTPEELTLPEKEFDFIYIGDLSKKRNPEIILDHFTRPGMQQRTLLLLGKDYVHLQANYQAYTNIIFKGPVAQHAVRDYILRSKFGINYIPDKAPFNQLTSTKLLEYAACSIPVISSEYAWVKQFQKQYGGDYFYLTPNLSNFTWENVTGFGYSFPDLSSWTWEQQIRRSGITEFLQSKFPGLQF